MCPAIFKHLLRNKLLVLYCRYQVWDAYSHSQVNLTGVTVVPHLTYVSPTTGPSPYVRCAYMPF